jgi:spore germination protein GerM
LTDIARHRALLIAALGAAMVAFSAGCTKQNQPPSPHGHQVTVYYCKAGTEELMPVDYTAEPSLEGSHLAEYATQQLLAGPTVGRDTVALFPTGTQIDVSLSGETATANLTGPVTKSAAVGTSDEVAMFKALVYTLTALPDIKSVRVLLDGKSRASLPGGHLELDQPLTRETFAQ